MVYKTREMRDSNWKQASPHSAERFPMDSATMSRYISVAVRERPVSEYLLGISRFKPL
jgi:hypothetical protein